jgi:hypothetical protein
LGTFPSSIGGRKCRPRRHIHTWNKIIEKPRYVRFGSKADMCGAQADVRYVPIADIPVRSHTALVIVTRFSDGSLIRTDGENASDDGQWTALSLSALCERRIE